MARTGARKKLTAAIQRALVQAVTAGVSLSCAAELVGLDPSTVSLWMSRGAGRHPRLTPAPVYVNFFRAITRARAQDVARRVARIDCAAQGGTVVYRKTTTQRDGATVVEERVSEPAYQADCWHLERSRPEEWGRKERLDVHVSIQQAAAKVAAELGMTVAEVLAEAQALLAEMDHGTIPG